MAWWSGLWLNEGFACFMQTWAANHIFPEWAMWNQFVTSDLAAALRLDSLRTSHPIQVPIKHAEEVEEVFDAISYSKGACVIRMLNAVLGEEAFRKGLQNYMKRHQFGNTETSDLWQAWQEASGKPIV
jgi:aminopeptidase N